MLWKVAILSHNIFLITQLSESPTKFLAGKSEVQAQERWIHCMSRTPALKFVRDALEKDIAKELSPQAQLAWYKQWQTSHFLVVWPRIPGVHLRGPEVLSHIQGGKPLALAGMAVTKHPKSAVSYVHLSFHIYTLPASKRTWHSFQWKAQIYNVQN